jgi:hypothetical protein
MRSRGLRLAQSGAEQRRGCVGRAEEEVDRREPGRERAVGLRVHGVLESAVEERDPRRGEGRWVVVAARALAGEVLRRAEAAADLEVAEVPGLDARTERRRADEFGADRGRAPAR